MKVCILYHPNSEHARQVEEFVRDFKKQEASRSIEMISVDSIEGANIATLYDVVSYPAILALDNNGSLLKYWNGPQLPLMNEVAFYAKS